MNGIEPTAGAPSSANSATRPAAAPPDRRLRTVMMALAVAGVIVAGIGNQLRVQDVDPQYTRVIIERTDAYGGSFYENGIFNKGPLELAVHYIGNLVTTYDGYWIAFSAFGALFCLVLAMSATRTARFAGASPPITAVVGVVAFMHFAFSKADYAGVVYVRNITVTMLAAWWIMLLTDRVWSTERRRMGATAVIGLLLGLAAQSLLATALSGTVLLVTTFLLLRDRIPGWERLRLIGIAMLVLPFGFLSATIWYAARGAFAEFWAGWWVHAGFMSTGTGRSLGSQLSLGWDEFYSYHQHPLIFGVIAVFVVSMVGRWRSWDRRQRVIHGAVLAWWAAAWLELVLSQRYSSHYFSITAVPVMLMAALLAGSAARALAHVTASRWASGAWAPIVAVVVAAYLLAPSTVATAVTDTVGFRGAAKIATERDRQLPGNDRTARAILDLVSDKGDPLLGWTNHPWTYLTMDRVSATRLIWRSFMLGDIYLGRSGPEFVLPQTWDWFFEDLRESNPVALAEVDFPVSENTPFASYAAANFTLVYNGSPMALSLRNNVAAEVIERRASQPWVADDPPAAGTAWRSGPGHIDWPGGEDPAGDLLPLIGSCSRVEGDISWPAEEDAILAFVFEDSTGRTERLYLGIDRGRAYSGSDFVAYESMPLGDAGTGSKTFALIVGRRSSALVIDDHIVAALRLPPYVVVSVEAKTSRLTLSNLLTGPAPALSGC